MSKEKTPPAAEAEETTTTTPEEGAEAEGTEATDGGQGGEPSSTAPEADAPEGDNSEESEPQAGEESEEGQAQPEASTGKKDGKPFNFEKGYNELFPQFTQLSQKLKPLQEFHDANSVIIEALERHPELLEQLVQAEKSRTLTPDQVQEMIKSNYATERQKTDMETTIRNFISSHKEFENLEFKQKFHQAFIDTKADVNEASMQLVFEALTAKESATRQAAQAVKDKQKQEDQKRLAGVGAGGSSVPSGTQEKSIFGRAVNPNVI